MANTDHSKGHVPVEHEFAFEKFSYHHEVHYQPCVKVAFYFKKRKDVSHEHFFKHWAQVHADLTLASRNFGLFQVQRYVQVCQTLDNKLEEHVGRAKLTGQHHQLPEMKEGLAKIGMNAMDFDGCSTLWFKTWGDFEKFFTSPGYQGRLTEDCKHFMDVEGGISAFAGHDMIAFGKGIPGVDDRDGITEYCPGDKTF
ncbi:hypothetical protein ACJ41O_010005 [Fusarium nematophilum]